MIAIYINEAEEVEAIMLERTGRQPKLLQEGVHYVTKSSADMPQLPEAQGVVSTMPEEDRPANSDATSPMVAESAILPVQDTVQDEPTFETGQASDEPGAAFEPTVPAGEVNLQPENVQIHHAPDAPEAPETPENDEMPPLMPENNPDLLPQNPFGAPNDEQELDATEVEEVGEADAPEQPGGSWSNVPPSPMPVNEEEDFEDPTLSTSKQPGV